MAHIPSSKPNDDLLTISEAASALGVSAQTLRRWEKDGKIEAIRPDGGARFFRRADVDRLASDTPLTVSQAAAILGISASKLRRLDESGELVPERGEGGQRLYSKTLIDSYQAQEAQPGLMVTPVASGSPSTSNPLASRQSFWLRPQFSLVLGTFFLLLLAVFARDSAVPEQSASPTTTTEPVVITTTTSEVAKNGDDSGKVAALYSDSEQEIHEDNSRVLGVTTSEHPNLHHTITTPSEFVVNLHTDGTYFRVQDHTHDVFRIDYDKNVTILPGSTLHVLGALKDKNQSTGSADQVLTAGGGGTSPIWADPASITAGGLDCDDCIGTQDIEDIFLLNTGDTSTGLLRVEHNFEVTGTTQFGGVTYTWPSSDGSSGQALSTNGSGALSWSTFSTTIADDSLDFDTFEDTLDLDAALAINTSGNNIVINEDGADSDFRIEGDTEANLFFVDASTNRIGIGTASPTSPLNVQSSGAATWITRFNDSGGTLRAGLYDDTSNPILYLYNSSGSQNVAIEGNGEIGVGDASPDATLELVDHGSDILHISATAGGDGDYVTVDSAGNIGIGTTSPTLSYSGIEISKTNTSLRLDTTASSGVAVIEFSDENDAVQYTSGYRDSTGNFKVVAGNITSSSGLTLDSSGNIGIGETSPTSILHLEDADPAITFDTTTATDTDYWLGVIEDAGGDDDDLFQIGDGTTVGTNPFLTIDTSGNVGVGTTAPTEELHVAGELLIQDTDTLSTSEVQLIFKTGTGNNTAMIEADKINSGDLENDLIFYAHDGSALSEVMRLEGSTGNVGLGTASPIGELEIDDGSNGTPTIYLTEASSAHGFFMQYDGANNDIRIGRRLSSGESVVLSFDRDSDYLAIGHAAPATLLHAQDGSGAILRLDLTGTNANVWDVGLKDNDPNFYITDGLDDRITIDTSGNVGIGTASPSDLLEVQAAAGSAGVVTLSTGELTVVDGDVLGQIDFQAPLESDGTDATLVGASIWAEADDTFSSSVNATELVFATGASEAATEKMRIDSAGNVGIGTSAPSDTLTIITPGESDRGITIRERDDGNDAIRLKADNSTGWLELYRNGTMNVKLDGTSTNTSYVNTAGFGIGETSPTSILHLEDADPAITFDTTTATDTDYWLGVIEDSGGDDDDLFQIGDGTTVGTNPFLTIDTSGNVGVGTTAPGELLDLNGGNLRMDHTTGRIIFHDGATNRGDVFSHTNGTWGVAIGGGDGSVDWWFDSDSLNLSASRGNIVLGSSGDHVYVGNVGSLQSAVNVISTTGGGSYPFDTWGHLMLAPQLGDDIVLGRDNDVVIDDDGNTLIGGVTAATSSAGTLHVFNGTAPTASATDGIVLYAEDVSASSELKVRDEAGNVTTLSPHNFSLFNPGDKDYAGIEIPWSFYSRNDVTGQEINVDMLGIAQAVETLTNQQFVYAKDLQSGDEIKNSRLPATIGEAHNNTFTDIQESATDHEERIDALEGTVAGISDELQDQLATLETEPTAPPTPTPTVIPTSTEGETPSPITAADILLALEDVETLIIAGGFRVQGDTSLFGDLTVRGDVAVAGKIKASGDTAGRFTLPEGVSKATIRYIEPYSVVPVVTVTALGHTKTYQVTEVSPEGFSVVLENAAGPAGFSWIAIEQTGTAATVTFEGAVDVPKEDSGSDPAPSTEELIDLTEPTLTPTPTPSPSATPDATPEPSPVPEAAPSPSPTPTPVAEEVIETETAEELVEDEGV